MLFRNIPKNAESMTFLDLSRGVSFGEVKRSKGFRTMERVVRAGGVAAAIRVYWWKDEK